MGHSVSIKTKKFHAHILEIWLFRYHRVFQLQLCWLHWYYKIHFWLCFMLAKRVVSWKSVKQSLIPTSNMQAEFIVCYEASNQAIWLWNFITGLHIVNDIERPLRINCDNKVAKLYSKNNRSSSKSKHIDLKFLVVQEKVQSFQVSIEHTSTNFMIAIRLPKVYHLKCFMSMWLVWVWFILVICLCSGSLLIDVH